MNRQVADYLLFLAETATVVTAVVVAVAGTVTVLTAGRRRAVPGSR